MIIQIKSFRLKGLSECQIVKKKINTSYIIKKLKNLEDKEKKILEDSWCKEKMTSKGKWINCHHTLNSNTGCKGIMEQYSQSTRLLFLGFYTQINYHWNAKGDMKIFLDICVQGLRIFTLQRHTSKCCWRTNDHSGSIIKIWEMYQSVPSQENKSF